MSFQNTTIWVQIVGIRCPLTAIWKHIAYILWYIPKIPRFGCPKSWYYPSNRGEITIQIVGKTPQIVRSAPLVLSGERYGILFYCFYALAKGVRNFRNLYVPLVTVLSYGMYYVEKIPHTKYRSARTQCLSAKTDNGSRFPTYIHMKNVLRKQITGASMKKLNNEESTSFRSRFFASRSQIVITPTP